MKRNSLLTILLVSSFLSGFCLALTSYYSLPQMTSTTFLTDSPLSSKILGEGTNYFAVPLPIDPWEVTCLNDVIWVSGLTDYNLYGYDNHQSGAGSCRRQQFLPGAHDLCRWNHRPLFGAENQESRPDVPGNSIYNAGVFNS